MEPCASTAPSPVSPSPVAEPTRLLLVDDNPDMIRLMARCLAPVAQLSFATHGSAALRQAQQLRPNLILLDAEMPGLSGFEVCEALRCDPATADIPVIFVTGHSGQAQELKGLELGAVDFIAKPISEPLLLARVRTQLRLQRLTAELRQAATVDALTGVLNRRSFDELLQSEWARARRSGAPLGLLLLDVDHFKAYNDGYGHPAGDACLQQVAERLRSLPRRPADRVARYGGEEFALLLPDTDAAGVWQMAQRTVEAVQAMDLPHAHSATARCVTVSVGAAVAQPGGPAPQGLADPASLLAAADAGLYAAKRHGRNQAQWPPAADGG